MAPGRSSSAFSAGFWVILGVLLAVNAVYVLGGAFWTGVGLMVLAACWVKAVMVRLAATQPVARPEGPIDTDETTDTNDTNDAAEP